LDEALWYKQEDRGFDSPWGQWIFSFPNPSSRSMVLGSTQSLTEKSIRNRPAGKAWPARKVNNLKAICEPIFYKMWESRLLSTLWAFTACYRYSVTCFM
jgi:hypothetical protein